MFFFKLSFLEGWGGFALNSWGIIFYSGDFFVKFFLFCV